MVFRSLRRNKQMILTRDFSFFFPPSLSLWNTEASKPGKGKRTRRQPTSVNNKLVVLCVDVTGTDLEMKLWSSCSRWGRLAFKPLKLRVGSKAPGASQHFQHRRENIRD